MSYMHYDEDDVRNASLLIDRKCIVRMSKAHGAHVSHPEQSEQDEHFHYKNTVVHRQINILCVQ